MRWARLVSTLLVACEQLATAKTKQFSVSFYLAFYTRVLFSTQRLPLSLYRFTLIYLHSGKYILAAAKAKFQIRNNEVIHPLLHAKSKSNRPTI